MAVSEVDPAKQVTSPLTGGIFQPYAFAFSALLGLVLIEGAGALFVTQRYLGRPAAGLWQVGQFTLAGVSAWLLIPLTWLGIVAISIARRRTKSPTNAILRIVRQNRKWLIRGLILFTVPVPLGRAFAAFKAAIPAIQPFDWDDNLTLWDRTLLGTDAWRLTHALIGPTGTVVLDRIYLLWGTYLVLLAGWIAFTRNRTVQIKAALTFNLCWFVIGTLFAIALASVGPCFVGELQGNPHFAPLMIELEVVDRDSGLFSFQAMDFLSRNAGTGKFGSGISAMPSMHISMATLGVILAFAVNARTWVKVIATAFASTIFVGSIHLGWHYAVDGLVSAPLTLLLWLGCSRFVEATSRRSDLVRNARDAI